MYSKRFIEEPCPANWNEMTVGETGRYCSSCEKIVVDFSTWTLDEIQAYFSARAGQRICGKYTDKQVNAPPTWLVSKVTLLQSRLFLAQTRHIGWRLSVSIVAILMVLVGTGCQEPEVLGKRCVDTARMTEITDSINAAYQADSIVKALQEDSTKESLRSKE